MLYQTALFWFRIRSMNKVNVGSVLKLCPRLLFYEVALAILILLNTTFFLLRERSFHCALRKVHESTYNFLFFHLMIEKAHWIVLDFSRRRNHCCMLCILFELFAVNHCNRSVDFWFNSKKRKQGKYLHRF